MGLEPLLDYSNLTLNEVRDKYAEVERTFNDVRRGYSFIDIFWRRKMRDEDIDRLKVGFSILMPLSHTDAVQNEVKRTAHYNSTLHSKVNHLSNEILSYAGRFKNTDVHFVGMYADEVA